MPLTHITKGISAEDLIREGSLAPSECPVFNESLAYFFYGRPAYRVGGDGAIKLEALCPFYFIFRPELIERAKAIHERAKAIHAFDTGAFANRMYSHIFGEEMKVEDFSLELDTSHPNKIISAVFGSLESYFRGDVSKMVPPESGSEAWEFAARAYLHLLSSPGRNEPDDRICSIEVTMGEPVPLLNNLRAVVVPHSLWGEKRAPWLNGLFEQGVEIVPYPFVPGRSADYYYAQLEAAVLKLYENWRHL